MSWRNLTISSPPTWTTLRNITARSPDFCRHLRSKSSSTERRGGREGGSEGEREGGEGGREGGRE